MEKVCFQGRLPLLNIKENVKLQPQLINTMPAYLPNDVISNLQSNENTLIDTYSGKLSNLWTSPKRREKFRHMSDNPICICGAGNDLTFLYDKLPDQFSEIAPEPKIINEKHTRKTKNIEDKMMVKISEKIFPDEFILSKHHGGQSIQIYDEKCTSKALPHDRHKIYLPIMNPNITPNTNKIYQSLMDIWEQSGVNDETDYKLSTYLHKLLKFLKKEQDLYNLVFHEIIKEITIECIERGELLSSIRQRYRNILIKVPEKIKDFHDKVVARKILDRRLTEELTRFQNAVSLLSSELSGIEAHEDNISQMCKRAKDQLKAGVEETRNNADLLTEYHELYEQQRRRLENTVVELETERDCWRTASYRITQLVLERYEIQPGLTLVECEYNTILLSQYFVELLTKTDNEALSNIKNMAILWCNEAQKFALMMAAKEEDLTNYIDKKIENIIQFKNDFQEDYLNDKSQLSQSINKEETQKILNLISGWEKSISEVVETFGGQSMLIEEEKLKNMKKMCLEYTDIAIEVFNRHRDESDGILYQEHSVLLELNKTIEKLMNQLLHQLTGENGVAHGIITLQTYLENWTTKLSTSLSEAIFRPIPDAEWIRLLLLLDDWINLLHESKNAIGSIQMKVGSDGSEIKKLKVHRIIQSVDNWSHKTSSGIESENLKLSETIINLKRNMIRWTSQIVLRLAPDFPDNSLEAKRAARIYSASIKELQENAVVLHENLSKFINYVIICSKDIVSKLCQTKLNSQSEPAENDTVKLNDLLIFSKSWIDNSQLVLKQLTELEYDTVTKSSFKNDLKSFEEDIDIINSKDTVLEQDEEQFLLKSRVETPSGSVKDTLSECGENDSALELKDSKQEETDLAEFNVDSDLINISGEEDKIVEIPAVPPSVEELGIDSNIHSRLLVQDPDQPYSRSKFQKLDKIDMNVELPQTEEAFQLIQVFEILQKNLRSLNSEALVIEEQYTLEDLEVTKSKIYLESLEQRFDKLSKELEQLQVEGTQTLQPPLLYSVSNTIETVNSDSVDANNTSKVASSSKRRVVKNTKKVMKKH